MQRVGMPAALGWICVMVIIEDPTFEIVGVDHQRVAVPLPDRVTIIRRLQIGAMRPPIERNDAG